VVALRERAIEIASDIPNREELLRSLYTKKMTQSWLVSSTLQASSTIPGKRISMIG
jgi:hypothetical protein